MKRALLGILTLSLLPIAAPVWAKGAEAQATSAGARTGAAKASGAAAATASAAKPGANSSASAKKPSANTAKPSASTAKSSSKPQSAGTSKSASAAKPSGSANKPVASAKKPSAGTSKPGSKATVAKQTKAKKTCYARPVQLVRVRGTEVEPHELSLTLCSGAPNLSALDELSIIARPRDVERPTAREIAAYRARPLATKANRKKGIKVRSTGFVSERVMRLNPGLLVRVQKVANRYPGKPIEVISGYRPDARETSRHHQGRALDLRVAGVQRERLVTFLRGFADTGVGYYPNSYFVHMDVRDQKAYWVDRSGPGEPADYGPWPVKKQPLDRERDKVVAGAVAALASLDRPVSFASANKRGGEGRAREHDD